METIKEQFKVLNAKLDRVLQALGPAKTNTFDSFDSFEDDNVGVAPIKVKKARKKK